MPLTVCSKNLLFARLHPAESQPWHDTRLVSWKFKQTLYNIEPINYVYFPVSGTTSALTAMDDGNAIEVATVGKEGMVGHTVLFAGKASPYEIIVQFAGAALRMDVGFLEQEVGRGSPLSQLLVRYNMAYLTQISQSVACNGLHPIPQRCCRWLLSTLDRMESNMVPLTQELLGIVLGVPPSECDRRSSLAPAQGPNQEQPRQDHDSQPTRAGRTLLRVLSQMQA